VSEPTDAERQLAEIEDGFGPSPTDPMDPSQWRQVSPSAELVEHMRGLAGQDQDRVADAGEDWTLEL
jgi:hypothetical protein